MIFIVLNAVKAPIYRGKSEDTFETKNLRAFCLTFIKNFAIIFIENQKERSYGTL